METEPQPISPIAQLNDAFRRSGQGIFATPGVLALPDLPSLVRAVQDFDTFTTDNDPYREHDFGSIEWQSEKTFWKIDYYDQDLQYWCDPLSPGCRRVLTIMLASEY
jgi:uncharacterized protein DUF3768